MKTRGTVTGISVSFPSQRAVVSFEVTASPADIEHYKDMDLDISFDKHRENKTEDQRKYFYKLVNLIAQKMRLPDVDVHDKLISECIAYHTNDGALDWAVKNWKPNQYGIVKDGDNYYLDSHMTVKMQKPDGSLLMKNGEPVIGRILWHIKGVAQMDIQEMSRLIEAAIYQAKDLGIPTETPEELRQMKERWGIA